MLKKLLSGNLFKTSSIITNIASAILKQFYANLINICIFFILLILLFLYGTESLSNIFSKLTHEYCDIIKNKQKRVLYRLNSQKNNAV